MLNKIKSLNLFLKAFVISSLFSLLLYVLMIPLLIFDLGYIPNGLILGEFESFIFLFVIGLVEERKPNNSIILIVLMTIRLTLGIGVCILSAFLWYKLDVKIFNIFATMSGYFIPTIILLITAIISDKRKGVNSNV